MTESVHPILQTISVEQVRRHILALQGVRHPVFAPQPLEQAASYIQANLESLGYEVFEQHFTEDDQDYKNIIGLRRGIRTPEKRVIVLAHYDTEAETPGANDNASGVAAVLELARVFQPLTFEATVQFIGVALEERKWGVEWKNIVVDRPHMPGILRGSQALAAHARANAWEILGVVNFEEIAYAGDAIPQKTPPGLPLQLPEAGNFIAIVGNENSAGLVKGFMQSIERFQLRLPCVPLIVPGNGEMLADTRRSDHAPFWDKGYRAIMLTDTANFRTPHYHQASDTLDTLNLDFAVEVCRAAAGLVMELAGLVEPDD